MRNDSIERSINDSMLTITDSILQMIEEVKKQMELDKKRIIDDELKAWKMNFMSIEERDEAEYELYYALIKRHQPDLFEVNGKIIESFPVDKGKSVFQVFQENNNFYGVYKQESKVPHKVTRV